VHYSLQGNHAHFIVEAQDPPGARARDDGDRLAPGARGEPGRADEAVGCSPTATHSRLLATPREVRDALRYVLLNARRHAAKLAKQVRLDPASSARWFDGWKRSAPSATEAQRETAVARARTWLLKIGWRRHGSARPRRSPRLTGNEPTGRPEQRAARNPYPTTSFSFSSSHCRPAGELDPITQPRRHHHLPLAIDDPPPRRPAAAR
jgi:hypothetical protein